LIWLSGPVVLGNCETDQKTCSGETKLLGGWGLGKAGRRNPSPVHRMVRTPSNMIEIEQNRRGRKRPWRELSASRLLSDPSLLDKAWEEEFAALRGGR